MLGGVPYFDRKRKQVSHYLAYFYHSLLVDATTTQHYVQKVHRTEPDSMSLPLDFYLNTRIKQLALKY